MFYGREDILAEMKMLWGKRVASLVTCRGRRRIGKSTLISEFARISAARFIRIEGIRPKVGYGNSDELQNFATFLSLQTGDHGGQPENWAVAFKRLDDQISDDERTVVLLDEVSWMGYYDPHFPDVLKIAWDTMFKRHDRLVLVVCGSVSTWIRENIIENGAYMGRRSGDFIVGELPLRDCAKFWGESAERLATREILNVLAVTGGVPRYLEEVNPALSADENIRRICFLRKSVLREDFDEMFNDVITAQPMFTARVLRCLVDGAMTGSQIAAKLEIGKGGNVSGALERLKECGLVTSEGGRNPETGKIARECRYRLSDNYTRFYLKYIEPVKDVIDAGSYAFTSLDQLRGMDVIYGLAFENLIVGHYRELLPRLGLAQSLVESAAPYVKRGNERKGVRGCQVDLLIQTAQSQCYVEIKHGRQLDDTVVDEMRAKLKAIAPPEGISVRTALVYDGQLAATVSAGGYFNALINVRELIF